MGLSVLIVGTSPRELVVAGVSVYNGAQLGDGAIDCRDSAL